jgi:cellulose synthase/poly-beta-1,6-N-acetylglucosamine synthase-like glycosyltransferase
MAYSVNLYYLMGVTLWRRRVTKLPDMAEIPYVTVQVPLYNERYVSRRIIDAVAKLDWPHDRLQIQVLDDSTDETKAIVAEAVEQWRARGLNIEQICRPNRTGYKAGALAYALPQATGELIAIFDADFIPPPTFLRDTVPALLNDPKAAFVQARWDHLNLQDSWLTRIQAIAIDSHFMIEQFARFSGGFAFNFNGTAGVWRRTAIDDAGGWQSHTLTEDLDLSYRAWLHGWHGLYRPEVLSPAELPPTMTAFRRQQARWQRGSIECARMLLPSIWRSKYPLLPKVQATIHLLGPLVTPIMAFLMLSYPLLLLILRQYPDAYIPMSLVNVSGPLTVAPTLFFLFSQLLARKPQWQAFVAVLLCQIIGAGMAMNTLRAVLKALLGQRGEFLRTPKWGDSKPTAGTYRLKPDVGVLIDLLWGFYCLVLVAVGLTYGHMFIIAYGLMSCLGSWWVALWTIWPSLRAAFQTRRAALTAKSA